jgi:hypothetical protein
MASHTPIDRVIPIATAEDIRALVTKQEIISRISIQDIILFTTIDIIVTLTPHQGVVVAVAIDSIISGSTPEEVRAISLVTQRIGFTVYIQVVTKEGVIALIPINGIRP